MKGKVILVLLVGIIILIAGSAYLLTRNNLGNNDKKAEENSPTSAYFRRIRTPIFFDGYSIELQNEIEFVRYLEERKVFGRANLTNGKKSTGFNGLDEIKIAIRKGPKPADIKPDYNNAFTALSGGLIQINFFLEDDELNDSNIGDLILKNTLGAIFKIVDKESKNEDIELDVEKSFEELKNKRGVNIILKKN